MFILHSTSAQPRIQRTVLSVCCGSTEGLSFCLLLLGGADQCCYCYLPHKFNLSSNHVRPQWATFYKDITNTFLVSAGQEFM